MHLLPADTSQGGVLPIPPLDVLQNSLEDPTSQVAPEVIMFSVLEGLQKLQTGFREHIITEMDCLIKDTIEGLKPLVENLHKEVNEKVKPDILRLNTAVKVNAQSITSLQSSVTAIQPQLQLLE